MIDTATTVIIFGVTGDLARRKIIPALYQLFLQNRSFIVIGFALEHVTEHEILSKAIPFIDEFQKESWNIFIKSFFYYQLDATKDADFKSAHMFIQEREKQLNCSGRRCVYLAVAAFLYESVTQKIACSGIVQKKPEADPIWHRVVYEKPFGHDIESAYKINAQIAQYLEEYQIYRIDHYLTKQLVSDILIVRFTNCVFEPLWNNRYIDQVHIMIHETIDIESRGGYYDQYGALADVVQNHMLQMLALIAMEAPAKLTGDEIRDKRIELLKQVQFQDGMTGQYKGYQQELGVKQNSQTETFAALLFYIKNSRWNGVPFFFTTGKCMDKREVAIHIKFKQVDCLLAKNCFLLGSNWLSFTLSPQERFSLQLNIKKPGQSDIVMPVSMDFSHGDFFSIRSSHAYEALIEEVFRGEQASCVRFDEIEESWRIVDGIRAYKCALYSYEKGTMGPQELQDFVYKWGMKVQK